MAELIKSLTPILRIVVVGSFVSGTVMAGLGVLLVFRGDSAETDFVFFGQTFKSQSVGIAAIFIGASMIVLVVRRALKSIDSAVNVTPPISVNTTNGDKRGNSIDTEQNGAASIVLELSEELQNMTLKFGLLHVRDGKDQVSDKGRLLNRVIDFAEIDRHGALVANVTHASQLGFQFKCFVDHKGTSFDKLKGLLSSNDYEGISEGGGNPFRAWFLLPKYATCQTIDGITNNFYYPA